MTTFLLATIAFSLLFMLSYVVRIYTILSRRG